MKTDIWNLLRRMSLAVVLTVLFVTPVGAIELGLTPSHVFATWININTSLVALGQANAKDDGRTAQLKAMKPEVFEGKKPSDVLDQVVAFRSKIDRLRLQYGLKPSPVYRDPTGGVVTPSVVFMNSGHVLDSTISLLIRLDGKHLVSRYYTRHEISGKSPSDVYGQVTLANRRMDALLN